MWGNSRSLLASVLANGASRKIKNHSASVHWINQSVAFFYPSPSFVVARRLLVLWCVGSSPSNVSITPPLFLSLQAYWPQSARMCAFRGTCVSSPTCKNINTSLRSLLFMDADWEQVLAWCCLSFSLALSVSPFKHTHGVNHCVGVIGVIYWPKSCGLLQQHGLTLRKWQLKQSTRAHVASTLMGRTGAHTRAHTLSIFTWSVRLSFSGLPQFGSEIRHKGCGDENAAHSFCRRRYRPFTSEAPVHLKQQPCYPADSLFLLSFVSLGNADWLCH